MLKRIVEFFSGHPRNLSVAEIQKRLEPYGRKSP